MGLGLVSFAGSSVVAWEGWGRTGGGICCSVKPESLSHPGIRSRRWSQHGQTTCHWSSKENMDCRWQMEERIREIRIRNTSYSHNLAVKVLGLVMLWTYEF